MDTNTTTLKDGTVVKRAYTDDFLEEQRTKALNYLGAKWPYHPANSPKKGDYSELESAYVVKKSNNFILQDFMFARHKKGVSEHV